MSCSGCSCKGNSIKEIEIADGLGSGRNVKLQSVNWLDQYSGLDDEIQLIEVRFKNTRKEYYNNSKLLKLKVGDMVAVESAYGHDIGTVSLTGKLAYLQLKRRKTEHIDGELPRVYRRSTANDMKLYREAIDREHETMLRGRQLISGLGLEMKLGDVEFQGDNTKAIFYYIAEGRVDFRQLIKVLAGEFKVRIEMKQIGSRQEAGRIGGIGSCGRELCCSSWKTNFQSVKLEAATTQDLPPNTQKLAGQCGKLKCCLLYELDSYLEAREKIPSVLLELETTKGIAKHHKTDVLNRKMYYKINSGLDETPVGISVERVKEIITLNKKGIKPDSLLDKDKTKSDQIEFTNTDISRNDQNTIRLNKGQRNKQWRRNKSS